MPKIHKGKYRIVVSLSPEEYQKLRVMAFEKEVTVNELIRALSVRSAELFIKEG